MDRRSLIAGLCSLALGTAAIRIDTSRAEEAGKVLAKGRFKGTSLTIRGRGTASIVQLENGEKLLRLSSFSVSKGPDLKVWLVKQAEIRTEDQVTGGDTLALGPLRSFSGDQDYAIPDGVDVSQYQSAIIWCEKFVHLFASADLKPES